MNYDQSFDEELLKVKGINPNWLPFIGLNYRENVNKILVIGESCYITDVVDVDQEEYIRKLIEAQGLKMGWYATGDEKEHVIDQRHKKLEKILSVDPENIDCKRKFWNKTAYYNFIQTPLESIGHRPEDKLFLLGWQVLFQILKILKPKFIVLNGVTSFNHFFEKYAEENGFLTNEKFILEKIGDTFPRKIILENKISGEIIKLLFIKHTARGIRLDSWHQFIKSELL